MKVNVISESAFTVQGHGVHTAFTETIDALKQYTELDVAANTNRAADIIHFHTVGPYSLAKLLFGKGAKVVSAHVTPDSFVGSLVGAKYWYGLARWYLRWFYNRAAAVLAVSRDVENELVKMGVTAPIYLVPNAIETKLFATTPALRQAARKAHGLAPDAFVVVGSGQLQPRKRLDSFAACARSLPDIIFVWAGGRPFKWLGADSAAMEALTRDHPANLIFTGLLPREEVLSYYHAADLFFLPSAQETFGIVVVEAAAAGLPVLLRDLEQYRHTFGDGYETGDDTTFTAIIERFRVDKDYYHHWQSAARSIARDYDAEAGAKRLEAIYREVSAAKAGLEARG